MKRFIYMLAAFALFGATSCQPDAEVAVHAGFTTDKESYDVGDPVVITNTSTAENALIAIYKWELGKGVVSYETTPENISYDQAGEYVIKLTVTSDRGVKKSSFEKTIVVVDNNIRPVADFSWSPEKVVAGEPVQFTDLSTDEDGEVVAWEWKFGTTTSDKQNPEFTFAAQGSTEVSLTVTDNKKGRNTKTVTIEVGRGAINLDLLWSYPYDDTKDAYVYGTSPAVSPDGEYVYVTSTGYSLVCFTKAGERLWAFDIGKDGASAENNSGSIKVQSPTPSVDADGTVYALAGFNEPNKGQGGSAFYAVSGGASGGSQLWYTNTGVNTSFRFLSPVITEKYVITLDRNAPSNQLHVYDKRSGALVVNLHCNSGSYGGLLALKSGIIVAGTGGKYGSRVLLPNGEGAWKYLSPDGTNAGYGYNYGWKDESNGSQPAADVSGKVYILYKNSSGVQIPTTTKAIVYCYDTKKAAVGVQPAPECPCGLKGD
ncbi:PKD domain-containing protein, partial [uncultured Alistipes sp.]|uniref:PKD domain-containing protein n=1 Tax=uncultured Alistipes sp. TaxID=538949 RepID=UPI00258D82CA